MRIIELSDIHLEWFYNVDQGVKYINDIRPVETADVLILAGDIFELNSSAKYRYLDEFRKWAIEIVYIPGNHEYYGSNPDIQAEDALKSMMNKEGIRVLGPNYLHSFTYNGIKFVGTTAWYPANETTRYRVENWSDCGYIKNFRTWWPDHALAERKLLWEEVEEGCIVMTHMLPVWECIQDKFKAEPYYNCLYVADLEDLILEKKPKLWFHGHTHEPVDMMVGNTRLLCNPIGYPHELLIRYPETVKILEIDI